MFSLIHSSGWAILHPILSTYGKAYETFQICQGSHFPLKHADAHVEQTAVVTDLLQSA